MFTENNSNYPITREFFLFSFALFFLAYWILLNSSFDALSILPALVLGLGSSVLLYAVLSLVGWAPPLLDYFKFLKMPKLNLKAPRISAGGVGGLGRKAVKPVFLKKPKIRVLKLSAPKIRIPNIRIPKIRVPKLRFNFKIPKLSFKAPKLSAPKIRIGGIRKKISAVTPRRKKYRR